MSNATLHTAAFNMRPELEGSPISLTGLQFPPGWHLHLTELQAERSGRDGLPNTPPVRSLNSVLRTFIPHLLTTPRQVKTPDSRNDYQPSTEPWLLAAESIPVHQLWLVVQAWLEQTFKGCDGLRLAQKALQPGDLRWEEVVRPLLGEPYPNGTAQPTGLAWSAVPALLAEQLILTEAKILVGGEERSLKRVPAAQGAELITWPPVYHVEGQDRSFGYSYTIKITLQTMVGEPHPRVHLHYGVRRWTSQPLIEGEKLRLGRTAQSVYLYRTDPWLGLNPTSSFAVARLRASYDGQRRFPLWDDLVPNIARRLNVAFPSEEGLLNDPANWLIGDKGVVAAIVEKSPNRRKHPVQAGLDLETHKHITRLIAEALAPQLSLLAPLDRFRSSPKVRKHPLAGSLREISVEQRLKGLEQSVGPNVTIEVYWDTVETRDMIMDRIQALLCRNRPGLVEDASGGHRKREAEPAPEEAVDPQDIALPGGGVLRLIPRRLGALGAAFPSPEQQVRRAEYKKKHTEERAQQIAQELPAATEPTLAVIELPNYQDPDRPKIRQLYGFRDPKRAIRLGMARAGRVSQFTTGASVIEHQEVGTATATQDDLRQRCESAVRDGLRHLGYLPSPIGFQSRSASALPENLVVAGVWQVRLTQKGRWSTVFLPVVVLMHTLYPEVRAWIPDGKGMRPYHQALRDITMMDPMSVKRSRRQDSLRALEHFLLRDLPAEGTNDILILASAQNIRQLWGGLQNGDIVWDSLRFDRGGRAEPLANLSARFRLIRLRTKEGGETPEWYTDEAAGGNGYTQGLWPDRDNSRQFYNNASKPHTQNKGRKGKQVDARENYALPALLEILTAALQPNDNALAWAKAIDEWRRMGGILTSDMLSLPLPLFLASRMDEYAEVIGPWVFPEQWNEEGKEDEETDMDAE